MYLQVNGEFIYPYGQDPKDPSRPPFEMKLNIYGLTRQTLENILRDFLRRFLGVHSIETLSCNIVHFDNEIGMIDYVHSCGTSTAASPTDPNSPHSFDVLLSILTLSGEKLAYYVAGKCLRVSIHSTSDSIFSIGYRLRRIEVYGH
jgi:hypothetical protein